MSRAADGMEGGPQSQALQEGGERGKRGMAPAGSGLMHWSQHPCAKLLRAEIRVGERAQKSVKMKGRLGWPTPAVPALGD